MVCFCSPYSLLLAVNSLTATLRPLGCKMDYMIIACIVKHATDRSSVWWYFQIKNGIQYFDQA